jgi:hypothetical protein
MMASASSSYDDRAPLMGSSPARGATLTSAASRQRPEVEPEPSKSPRLRTVSVISSVPDEDDLNLVNSIINIVMPRHKMQVNVRPQGLNVAETHAIICDSNRTHNFSTYLVLVVKKISDELPTARNTRAQYW